MGKNLCYAMGTSGRFKIVWTPDTENGIKNGYISGRPLPDPVLEMLVHLKIAKDLEKYSSLHTSQEIPR